MEVNDAQWLGLLMGFFAGLSLLGFIFGAYSAIIVKAMEKSTHQVTYMPITGDSPDNGLNKEWYEPMELSQ